MDMVRDGAAAQAPGTQSLERALGLLRIVASHSQAGLRLADAVARSGLAKPTVHRLLQALERQGFIAQDKASRLYHLGPEAFVIGTLAEERFGIHRAAQPCLARLAVASEDTAFLSIRRERHSVCLHREVGAFPIRALVLQVGDRHPLGVGAGSLAILASLADAEVEEILAQNEAEMAARFPHYTAEGLRADIARARATGFALNMGKVMANSWAVGVAVMDRAGRCQGALSVGAIDSRLAPARQEDIARLLRTEAAWLADRLERPERRPAPKIQKKDNGT